LDIKKGQLGLSSISANAQKRQRDQPPVLQRQLSSAWSKWFGRYLRGKCGITDSAKVFHSFRHTFKRMTCDAELAEELHGEAARGGKKGRPAGSVKGKRDLTPPHAALSFPVQ